MRNLRIAFALATCLAIVPGTAHAFGHGNDNGHHDRDKEKDDKHGDRDKHGDHDRDNDHGRPAGWSHGKKKGWGGCDVPPGQAKKQGCHDRDDHRDHDRDRRAHPGYTAPHAPIAPRPVAVVNKPVVVPPRPTPPTPAQQQSWWDRMWHRSSSTPAPAANAQHQ